jgi:hypothetical protein
MNRIARFVVTALVLMCLLTSCGQAVEEEIQLNNLSVILVVDNFTVEEENPSAIEAENCTVTPDGQGLSGGRGSSTTILGEPHGFYVYRDLVRQIGTSPVASDPAAKGAEFSGITNLSWIDPATSSRADLSTMKRADLFFDRDTGETILVVAVDTNGFEFNAISANIPRAVTLVSSGSGHFERYVLPVPQSIVVNMSFVFVPCDPMVYINVPLTQLNNVLKLNFAVGPETSVEELNTAYDRSKENTEEYFYEYVNQPCETRPEDIDLEVCIAADPTWHGIAPSLAEHFNSYYQGEADMAENAMYTAFITHLIYSPDDLVLDDASFKRFEAENLSNPNDPTQAGWLQKIMAQFSEFYSEDSNVIFVAAAGNFGHPYPFAPAAWNHVIAVSSEKSSQPSHSEEQTLTSGLSLAKYSNWGEVQLDGDYFDNPDSVYGTSFAAPKLSAKIAQNLLRERPITISISCPMTFNTSVWDGQRYNCAP